MRLSNDQPGNPSQRRRKSSVAGKGRLLVDCDRHRSQGQSPIEESSAEPKEHLLLDWESHESQ